MIPRSIVIFLLSLTNCIYPMYHIEKAIYDNNTAGVARIIAVGPTVVNILCNTGDWSRPLHLAAQKGRLAITQMLLDNGAKPNVKNIKSETPLDYAIIYNELAIARLLLENGANPNISTPLHYAVIQKNRKAVELLLRFGSSTQRRNILFLLPQDYSLSQKITDIINQRHKDHQRLMVLSAATHPRLGEHSPAQVLTRDDLSIIAQHLMNLEKPLDMQYSRPQRANYCSTIAKLAALGGISAATAAFLLPYLSNSYAK